MNNNTYSVINYRCQVLYLYYNSIMKENLVSEIDQSEEKTDYYNY